MKITLGITGSVAAIEVPKIIRRIREREIKVECVMSDAAQDIIHADTIRWASKNPVVTKLTGKAEHIRACKESKMFLVCPCTANTLSKMAQGIADTPVSSYATTALGSEIIVAVAPAMHDYLFQNPFIQENIQNLKEKGVEIIEAERKEGKAKLASRKKIVDFVIEKTRR